MTIFLSVVGIVLVLFFVLNIGFGFGISVGRMSTHKLFAEDRNRFLYIQARVDVQHVVDLLEKDADNPFLEPEGRHTLRTCLTKAYIGDKTLIPPSVKKKYSYLFNDEQIEEAKKVTLTTDKATLEQSSILPKESK